MQKIIINNEDKAWEIFGNAAEGSFSGDIASIEFAGWPTLELTLNGGKFDASLTAAVMENLIEVQKSLNRSYALLNYNIHDSRKNTSEDRNNIELIFKVNKGSSEITAAVANGLQNLITSIGDKMDPTQFLILVLGGGLLYFGQSVYKARLNKQLEEKKMEVDLAIKKEDTDRFQMLSDVVTKNTALRTIAYESEDAQASLVKAASYADSATLMGISGIGKVEYQALTKNPRSKSKEVRLDGAYKILVADQGQSEGRFKLSSESKEFTASLDENNLEPEDVDTFKRAFWERTEINLEINAKLLRGEVISASIVGVKSPEEI